MVVKSSDLRCGAISSSYRVFAQPSCVRTKSPSQIITPLNRKRLRLNCTPKRRLEWHAPLPCKPLALSAKRGQNGGEKIAFCQLFVTHFSAADFEKFEHKTWIDVTMTSLWTALRNFFRSVTIYHQNLMLHGFRHTSGPRALALALRFRLIAILSNCFL